MNGDLLALAGGGGGAKLAHGFSLILESKRLIIVGNTGDDEVSMVSIYLQILIQ